MSTERLRFMEASEGSEEFTSSFREGLLRYVVPFATVLLVIYIAIGFFNETPISSYAFLLLSSCGATVALYKLGHSDFALKLLFGSSTPLVWMLSYPTADQLNGFLTGSAYLLCLTPILWWMCFTGRRSRIVVLVLSIVALCSIAFLGQTEESTIVVPDSILFLGLTRSLLVIATTMMLGHTIELSIQRFEERWKKSFAKQQALTLKMENQTRDLEREASAHQATLLHLSRSESRYRKLFDNAFDGIIIYDSHKESLLEINETFCNTLGYSEDEVKSIGLLSLSPEKQADGRPSAEVHAEVKAKLDEGHELRFSWRHSSRYGEMLDFEIHTFKIPGEDHIRVSLVRDVSVKLRTQKELEEANRELRTFAHAASHDLKEPLRTMSNFAKMLDRRYADKLDDSGREYINYITEAASRGTTLVHDLLRFAEVGTDQITTEIVSLNQVAATVQQTVSARLEEEGASLIIDDLPEVIATPTWTQQLLQNLISNALKFKREDVKPEVHVFAKAEGSSFEIYVKDNGIGIAEENLERVFGVFERLNLRENFEGNGIGLALCQRIMKKLGGSIRVESTLGLGTTFILSFPMLSPEPTRSRRSHVSA